MLLIAASSRSGPARPAGGGDGARPPDARGQISRDHFFERQTAHPPKQRCRPADVAQEVEQLTCNQQVVGSTPTIGSTGPFAGTVPGEVPERPKGADCKSAGVRLRRFESSPLHTGDVGASDPPVRQRGSSSVGRARAFQARGRGFDSRLPLVASCAHVAQAAEHFLGKEEVTGSNPVVGSPGHNH
jgi:hypothetical protein